MADRFVSGGTITSSGQVSHDESGHAAVVAAHREPLMKRSAAAEEWETVQHELEEERKRRERARADLAAEGQQSLYDVLQANKGVSLNYPPTLKGVLIHEWCSGQAGGV